jgi:3-oxoacyl-[acyl-carrier protein] reductase
MTSEMISGTVLAGKVALVTGASRGIGRAIAERLGGDGAFVVVHYNRREDLAADVVAEIEKAGGRAAVVQADFSQPTGAAELLQAVDRVLTGQLGTTGIDILVNNAGTMVTGMIGDITEAAFDEAIAVNVRAPFFITQLALPRLRDGGRVIFMCSTLATKVFPGYTGYAPTKAALGALTVHLAAELGPRGITVNALVPGATDTDINATWLRTPEGATAIAGETALGRVGGPADVARVARFLAGPDSGWVTGQRIEVSGGHRL